MKPTNLTIKNLFTDDAKLMFLIGAGCSVDAPSCLPAGRAMMEAIIKYSCAESEIKKLLKLVESGELRFEALVEIIRDRLDPELKIIDYYGQCDKPNLQHFFLAEMIKKGHFVMTTNFDFLIEYALLQSNIPNDEVIPVITKKDFKKYKNPYKLFKKGKKTVYKIHGSTKNVITGENTKDSLVATIQAFGSNKEGLTVFQVEPFKRDLFDNVSNGRSLVVMGYSGSDDFDVVPTLKVLKNLRKVIWINFVKNNDGKEKIYEIDDNKTEKLDKVNQILIDIKRKNNAEQIYRVDVNTSKLIIKLLGIPPEISSNNFSVNQVDWLSNNITSPNELMKYDVVQKIYRDFDMYDDVLRYLEKIIKIANMSKNHSWKAKAFNRIGEIYRKQRKYTEALRFLNEALNINKESGDLVEKSFSLQYIGTILKYQGRFQEALKYFKDSLQIDKKLGDLDGQAASLNYIGSTLKSQGNYPKALKFFKEGLRNFEKCGNLDGKASSLYYIGLTYKEQGDHDKALEQWKEVLLIDDQLGKLDGKCDIIGWMGEIYQNQENYDEALMHYEEALKIAEQLGSLPQIAAFKENIEYIKNIMK